MAVPDYQSLMLPILKSAANGEVRIGEVVENLAGELGLTEEDRSELLPRQRHTSPPALARKGMGSGPVFLGELGIGLAQEVDHAPRHLADRQLDRDAGARAARSTGGSSPV